jgi:hypothetical protein
VNDLGSLSKSKSGQGRCSITASGFAPARLG